MHIRPFLIDLVSWIYLFTFFWPSSLFMCGCPRLSILVYLFSRKKSIKLRRGCIANKQLNDHNDYPIFLIFQIIKLEKVFMLQKSWVFGKSIAFIYCFKHASGYCADFVKKYNIWTSLFKTELAVLSLIKQFILLVGKT